MRRGAAGLLVGIVFVLVGLSPAGAATCWFNCTQTTRAPYGPSPTIAPAPPPKPPEPAPVPFEANAAAQRFLDLTNGERAAVGLGPLVMRADVVAIAAEHSAAMAGAGSIWHNEAYLTQGTRHALGATMLGENVGMGGTVERIHRALMNSPGHKANILEPAFSVVGMAVAQGSDGLIYVTQAFLQPNGAARPVVKKAVVTKPAAAPKPKPAVARAPATPKPAPPATTAATAPPTTAAPPVATTEADAVIPDLSVLATMASPPAPLRQEQPSPVSATELIALALVAATATGAVRVTRRA